MLNSESQRTPSRAAPEGLVTADMLAQYTYCERRFHLVYVEGRWADNAFTDEGRFIHRRVDEKDGAVPSPETHPDRPQATRSVSLTDDELGLHGKLDLVETDSDGQLAFATPVETKRGRAPEKGDQPWEPERVQLMAQGLLLRANGFRCIEGVVYYAGSHKRISVAFDVDLEGRTREVIHSVKALLGQPGAPLPPPLSDSPKCPGCSLAGICLPDETLVLRERSDAGSEATEPPRRFFPARDDALPLYVQEQGSYVGKEGESIYVSRGKERLVEVRLKDMSQLVLCGSISVSPAATNMLCEASVPVVHLSMGHWFYGITTGVGLRNSFDRAAQFRKAAEPAFCLEVAKAIVKAKLCNQRTLLRRNGAAPDGDLDELARCGERVAAQESSASLLGIEGIGAAAYFRNFASMLRPRDGASHAFDFANRNRRPPKDPVNAMLSFGYAMLAKECTIALLAVGLDPYWGFYHQPRHGRPALALDLMEEFRPLVVDSALITAVNTGMVAGGDFVTSAGGCALTDSGRKAFIRAYEARMEQMATHPVFDYRCSWRRIISVQAQVLARVVRGDVPTYAGITTR